MFYAHHTSWDGRNVTIRMHRLIASPAAGMVVDHIDGNGLNNTRANLRICRHIDNIRNQAKRPGSSQFKGVHRRKNRWGAMIYKDKALHFLGSFLNEIDAAKAYDVAAIEAFGAFARINFPDGVQCP